MSEAKKVHELSVIRLEELTSKKVEDLTDRESKLQHMLSSANEEATNAASNFVAELLEANNELAILRSAAVELERKKEEIASNDETEKKCVADIGARLSAEVESKNKQIIWLSSQLSAQVETLAAQTGELSSKVAEYENLKVAVRRLEGENAALESSAERDINSLTGDLQVKLNYLCEMDEKIETLQSEKATLQSEKATLQSEKAALQSEKAALQSEKAVLQSEVLGKEETLEAASRESERYSAKGDELQGQLSRQEEEKLALQSDKSRSELDLVRSLNMTAAGAARCKELEGNLLALQNEKAALQARVNDTERDLGSITKEARVSASERDESREKIQELEEDISVLKSESESSEERYEAVSEKLVGAEEQLKQHRLRVVQFLADSCRAEMERRQVGAELESARSSVNILNERLAMLTSAARSTSPGDAEKQIKQIIELNEQTKATIARQVEVEQQQQQKLTRLKFELKQQQQETSAAQQRCMKLELLLGDKNETMMKHVDNEHVIEELKGALHSVYEKLEDTQNRLIVADKEESDLRSQLDESAEAISNAQQSLIELKLQRDEASERLERLTKKVDTEKDEALSREEQDKQHFAKVVERVSHAEDLIRELNVERDATKTRLSALEIENSQLRAACGEAGNQIKRLVAYKESLTSRSSVLAEENEKLVADLQRLKEASAEELEKEKEKHVSLTLQLEAKLSEEKEKLAALEKVSLGRFEASKDEISKLKDVVFVLQMRRDEEVVRSDELSAEVESLKYQLDLTERVKSKLVDAERRIDKLLDENSKIERIMQMQAARRMLEARLNATPLKLMTPGGIMKAAAMNIASPHHTIRSTPSTLSPDSGLYNSGGGSSVGTDLSSAFSSVVRSDAETNPMTPAAVYSGVKAREETPASVRKLRIDTARAQESSAKWQEAANSLQIALDAAIVSRDAYMAKCVGERKDKESVIAMFEKEKKTVGEELRLAFEQARVNHETSNKVAADATQMKEAKEKMCEDLTAGLKAAKKQCDRLRENLEVSSKECGELARKCGKNEIELQREKDERKRLIAKFKEVEGEVTRKTRESNAVVEEEKIARVKALTKLKEVEIQRNSLKASLESLREVYGCESQVWGSERERLECKIRDIQADVSEALTLRDDSIREKERALKQCASVKAVAGVPAAAAAPVLSSNVALVTALRAELAERDVEVQTLRKKVKRLDAKIKLLEEETVAVAAAAAVEKKSNSSAGVAGAGAGGCGGRTNNSRLYTEQTQLDSTAGSSRSSWLSRQEFMPAASKENNPSSTGLVGGGGGLGAPSSTHVVVKAAWGGAFSSPPDASGAGGGKWQALKPRRAATTVENTTADARKFGGHVARNRYENGATSDDDEEGGIMRENFERVRMLEKKVENLSLRMSFE